MIGRNFVNVASPRDLPQDVWSCIDLVCVNETECAAICGVLPEDDGTLGQALDLLIKRGVGCAVVTLGAGGSAAREGTRLYRAPAARVNVVDTNKYTYLKYRSCSGSRYSKNSGIFDNFISHFAVVSADLKLSATIVTRLIPL